MTTSQQPGADERARDQDGGPAHGRCRILLVDDDAILVELNRRILTIWGYEVVGVAASGEAAVTKAEALAPDLVVMDVHLRGVLGGYEAARRIRAIRPTRVIFVTGFREPEADDPELGAAPDTAVLEKPVRPQDLREAVERLTESIR